MSSRLSTLVYSSRNAIEDAGGDVRVELNRILSSARRNNPGLDVTGALVFSENRFAQVLEGPEASVDAIYNTIEIDPRHCDVVILKREAIRERTFPRWSMAFVQVGGVVKIDGGSSQPIDAFGSAKPPETPERDLVAALFDLIALHKAEAGEALAWPTFGDEA